MPEASSLTFHKQSLLSTIEYGYFDDLLIGNFMKVQLVNTKLYPHFTPLMAKIEGNARSPYEGASITAFWCITLSAESHWDAKILGANGMGSNRSLPWS